MIAPRKPWLLEPWRTRLLFLSLAINVFAIPALLAPLVLDRRPHGPPNFERLVDRLARDLPSQDAAILRATMTREQPWYDQGRRSLDTARAEVAQAVAQTPYDPAQVDRALQSMQDRLRESAVRFDQSLVAAVGQLSPDGRARMAESIRRSRP